MGYITEFAGWIRVSFPDDDNAAMSPSEQAFANAFIDGSLSGDSTWIYTLDRNLTIEDGKAGDFIKQTAVIAKYAKEHSIEFDGTIMWRSEGDYDCGIITVINKRLQAIEIDVSDNDDESRRKIEI